MKGKLRYLTISQALLLVSLPFLEEGKIQTILLTIFLAAIFLSGIYAVSYRRINTIIAISLSFLWVTFNLIDIICHSPFLILSTISNIFLVLFYVFTMSVVLSFVIKSERITKDVLYGAVSIYLFVAGTWGVIYTIIETILPGSFYIEPLFNIDNLLNWSDFLYYSFTTLTTLGYGDIIPITSPARFFAVLEATIGVMYLAIIISRLVGLYIAQSLK